ncbi:VCBS domain-containing protein [Mesorhizobium sp. M1B.F.Ca.ET.045.04.1.1]|uniref:VCBS domain-containing protein n=1 Tax=Mesorhizobium sp. M1B.F.Ca.ET.045.04.1.1 TaxID=2493673 RepID=UPI001FE11CD0|nr:VCBS domain-containing protein [Mesorhizobium sp. M1B.F.Ca.ET.045.04.1.1]
MTNGVHGTLSINAAGEWSYALNEDDAAVQALNVGDPALTDTITVQTSDGTTKDITITINGANDAAVITGDDRSVTEPPASERHGRHLAGDRRPRRDRCRQRRRLLGRDQRRARHAEHQCGRRVELRAQRGRCAVQALNVGDPALTDTITVQTSDGTTKDIVISINGANDAAVITGDATGSVTEASGVANGTAGTSPATGDLDATDVDSAPTSRW